MEPPVAPNSSTQQSIKIVEEFILCCAYSIMRQPTSQNDRIYKQLGDNPIFAFTMNKRRRRKMYCWKNKRIVDYFHQTKVKNQSEDIYLNEA